jgi:carbamoyltransferase
MNEPSMWILGISRGRNGSVALLRDGRVVCAIQAERLTRVKGQVLSLDGDADVITRCVRYCLDVAGIQYEDLSAVAICTVRHVPSLSHDRISTLIGGIVPADAQILSAPKHLSHAEYALHYSPLDPGLVLIADGGGTYEDDRQVLALQETVHSGARLLVGAHGREVVSAYVFDGASLELVYRVADPFGDHPVTESSVHGVPLLQSLGHLWRWASWYCGGASGDAEKVMALAAHGDASSHATLGFARLESDGRLSIRYDLLNDTFRNPNVAGRDISGEAHYADLAAVVQDRTSRLLTGLLAQVKNRHSFNTLYYGGSASLNILATEEIRRSGLFGSVHMNGSGGENGAAIGVALAAYHKLAGRRVGATIADCYGRTYPDEEIEAALAEAGCASRRVDDDQLAAEAARLIADGAVIGWFQGASEFGPRALGNRSILADPTDPHVKYVLDLIIKKRARFQPYAASVLAERCAEYFDLHGPSPVMARIGRVQNPVRLPAISHVDRSARIHTVTRLDNARFHNLVRCFEDLNGVPVLLNTSFNRAGEPIVETPGDAVRCFVESGLRNLVIGNYIAERPILT